MQCHFREFHREQLSIENSMRDLDSAVGRLDNILMTVYFVVAILIIAVALVNFFLILTSTFLAIYTGGSTRYPRYRHRNFDPWFVSNYMHSKSYNRYPCPGLSWLIGGSLQEVLTSIIFLFVKHPFDVGDKVILDKEMYTVKEIRLLSTIFLDSSSILVQAPNNMLNSLVRWNLFSPFILFSQNPPRWQFIQNLRRSPQGGCFDFAFSLNSYVLSSLLQMSETFTFDVDYATTFEDLERLREKMLTFLESERRDYHPVFDVNIKGGFSCFHSKACLRILAMSRYSSSGKDDAISRHQVQE